MSDDIHITRETRTLRELAQAGARLESICGLKTEMGNPPLVCGPPATATCWRCIHLQLGWPLPTEPPTPEHDRLARAKKTDDATQLVGEFVHWLGDAKKISLGVWHEDEMYPARESVQSLLAEFFGINAGALESEKQAMLDHLRATHEARDRARDEGHARLAGSG